MDKTFLSSGDVIADRRAHYAQMLAASGDPAAAAELMAQALDLVPRWAAGLDLLGRYAEAAGNMQAAVAAWRDLATVDASGMFGADLKLAAHGAGAVVAETSVGYVEALFDQYAPGFDTHLVEHLGYVVPDLLGAEIEGLLGNGDGQLAVALDLGCGTGLMGERIRHRVSFLEGIDLSARMVAVTESKGLYDRIGKAELLDFLGTYRGPADLITAADVFMYCGALAPVFASVYAALRPGGLFAFSVEAHQGEEDIFLRSSLRYAHRPAAVRADLEKAGFEVSAFRMAVIRQDRGEGIGGLVVVARRPRETAVAEDGNCVAATLAAAALSRLEG